MHKNIWIMITASSCVIAYEAQAYTGYTRIAQSKPKRPTMARIVEEKKYPNEPAVTDTNVRTTGTAAVSNSSKSDKIHADRTAAFPIFFSARKAKEAVLKKEHQDQRRVAAINFAQKRQRNERLCARKAAARRDYILLGRQEKEQGKKRQNQEKIDRELCRLEHQEQKDLKKMMRDDGIIDQIAQHDAHKQAREMAGTCQSYPKSRVLNRARIRKKNMIARMNHATALERKRNRQS